VLLLSLQLIPLPASVLAIEPAIALLLIIALEVSASSHVFVGCSAAQSDIKICLQKYGCDKDKDLQRAGFNMKTMNRNSFYEVG
jgi:hypothetical protein